jgi:hypothetical protein
MDGLVTYPAFDGDFYIRGIHRGTVGSTFLQFGSAVGLLACAYGPVNLGNFVVSTITSNQGAFPYTYRLYHRSGRRNMGVAGGIQNPGLIIWHRHYTLRPDAHL